MKVLLVNSGEYFKGASVAFSGMHGRGPERKLNVALNMCWCATLRALLTVVLSYTGF